MVERKTVYSSDGIIREIGSSDYIASSQIPLAQPSNILINGGFEIWQRGTIFNNVADGNYTVDMWKTHNEPGATAPNISQESSSGNFVSGKYSAKIVIPTTGTAVGNFYQPLEKFEEYKGKTLSFSIKVKCSVSNKVRAYIYDGSGVSYSNYHTGDNTFQNLIVIRTIPNSGITTVMAGIEYNTNVTMTFYVDEAMLVIGSQPANYIPKLQSQDLTDCQRYYEYGGGGLGYVYGPSIGSYAYIEQRYNFKVTKAGTPTMTVYNFNSAGTGSYFDSFGNVNKEYFNGRFLINGSGTLGLIGMYEWSAEYKL